MRAIVCFLCAISLVGSSAWSRGTTTRNEGTQSVAEVQQYIRDLEYKWAQVDVTNDRSIFDQIIAADFHSTSSRNGQRKNRTQWLADWEYEGVKSATNIDPIVQVFSQDLAMYSGIDETKGLNKDGTTWVHQDICTDTWLKRQGRWQCIAAHCSRIK